MISLAYVRCPKCQTVSQEDSRFCFRCGESLAGAAPAPAPPPAPIPGFPTTPGLAALGPLGRPFGTAPPPVSYEFRRNVDRTRTGVVLLAIGVLVALVPVIGIVGSLLSLAGAILVILGRKAFGARHARNVVLAIVLFLVGFVGGFLLTLGVFASIGTAILASPSQIQAAVTNAFSNLLVGAIVIGLISGLASVLFLWELLSTSGRILVLASYAVSVGMDVAIYLFVMGRLGPALAAASGSPPDLTPLLALDLQLVNLRLLDVFPTVLLAAAAYVAWSRIKSGEIPKKGTGASRASAE